MKCISQLHVKFVFLRTGVIIQRLGYEVVFSCCIGTLAIRCCLLFTIVNPWWFLGVGLLNGISYALFHACIASYASHLAPPGGQATMQAFARAGFIIGKYFHCPCFLIQNTWSKHWLLSLFSLLVAPVHNQYSGSDQNYSWQSIKASWLFMTLSFSIFLLPLNSGCMHSQCNRVGSEATANWREKERKKKKV